MRPPGTAPHLERRRRQAIRLLKAGTALSAIAWAVGASVSSVFRWAEAYRKQRLQGLRSRPTPGRPPVCPWRRGSGWRRCS
ncbi:MAG: helix-turn-helix domain-containing protein [Nitrospira sp. LK70]|nr:helix-turn-helix domain-containing protein [Nitrospira sp. LK70]